MRAAVATTIIVSLNRFRISWRPLPTCKIVPHLHLSLLFLQRALWRRNVQRRFLETFWLLDYLTAQHVGIDPLKNTRKEFFDLLQKFVDEKNIVA